MSTPAAHTARRAQPRPRIALGDDVRERVRALALWFDDVAVADSRSAFEELLACAGRYAARHAGDSIGSVPGVGEARRLYQSFGVDPTKTRPSNEALLRRALKGLPLYHVDNVVDVGNLVSLATLLPLGLYDRDALAGEQAVVRLGRPGESYEGIRKGDVHLEGRLTVADDAGPFGSPTSDSFRARIQASTQRVLVIVFAPCDGERARLERAGDLLGGGFARHAGGIEVGRQLLAA